MDMKRLLSFGLNDELKDFQVSLVKDSNIAALVLMGMAVIATAVLFVHSPGNIGFGLIFFAPSILIFVLNAISNVVFSRIVFVLLTSFLICITHAYFVGVGQPVIIWLFLAQFISFLMVAVLFDTREKLAMGISAGFVLVFFLCFPFFNSILNIPQEVELLRSETAEFTFIAIDVALAIIAMIYIQQKKFKSELAYEEALIKLEEKDEELNKQEKELQNTLDEITSTHKEDDKRNWISEGIGQLNNILQNSNDVNLFNKVLTHTVRFLGVNQGGIYEVNEDDFGNKFFVSKALYGYGGNRLENGKTSINDVGVLGDSYKEKAPVFRVEVPENYTISSGLGDNMPGCVFVVPMVYENNIEGMLELASFKKLDEHDKEYIQKVAGVLARFLESYQINSQSSELLEKTNQQTEEMRAQEEEMRQNMEELQATQEELHRKEREYIARIKGLEDRLKN